MCVITLLTDFGTCDTYVGQMKGVIADIARSATVIDLTHQVPWQDVVAGALMLEDAIDVFPAGTIHVAVVDPGVGTQRRAIAIETDHFTFVGPDNGLFTAVLQRHRMHRAHALTNTRYQRPAVSATFHGRDVFAPAAAHLAAGVPIAELGEAVEQPFALDLPKPAVQADTLGGQILWIDHFGNLITNIRQTDAQHGATDRSISHVRVADTTIGPIRRTFSDVPAGSLVAYFGSAGRLEIARRNGSAARLLKAEPGTAVYLTRSPASC